MRLRLLLAPLLATTLAPLPAAAETAPSLAAALDICQAEGPDLAGRGGQLAAAGWRPIAEEERAAAALALAPGNLVRVWTQLQESPVARRALKLQHIADGYEGNIAVPGPSDVWLALPGAPAWLLMLSPTGSFVICTIAAADLTTPDLAATLGGPIETLQLDGLTIDYIITGRGRSMAPTRITFADDAFGALATLPITALPPAPITD